MLIGVTIVAAAIFPTYRSLRFALEHAWTANLVLGSLVGVTLYVAHHRVAHHRIAHHRVAHHHAGHRYLPSSLSLPIDHSPLLAIHLLLSPHTAAATTSPPTTHPPPTTRYSWYSSRTNKHNWLRLQVANTKSEHIVASGPHVAVVLSQLAQETTVRLYLPFISP